MDPLLGFVCGMMNKLNLGIGGYQAILLQAFDSPWKVIDLMINHHNDLGGKVIDLDLAAGSS